MNCTVVSNSASYYGGIGSDQPANPGQYGATNCVIYFNAAGTNANYGPAEYYTASLNYCCTSPLPGGTGNFTNKPTFMNFGGGDYHPDLVSPLINAGLNQVVTNAVDLVGNPRIAGGTVDVGCYEWPSPASIIAYTWLENYHLPTDGTADFRDSDGDGMNNWQEWIAGTNPTNPASLLVMKAPVPYPSRRGWNVTWQSVAGKNYYLQRSTNLMAPSGFSIVSSNLTGQAGSTTYFNGTAPNSGSVLYRAGVQY